MMLSAYALFTINFSNNQTTCPC